MFQQGYERPRKPIPARISLTTGGVSDGRLMVLKEETLVKALNNAEPFLMFESIGGERQYIAKAAVAAITELEELAAPAPAAGHEGARVAGRFASTDPWQLLGLEPGAAPEAVREAYHRLAREFHTDRLAALGLHAELTAYAEEVLKRVNVAYNQLERAARVAA
jgi:DnaJ-domain-containing protein 1